MQIPEGYKRCSKKDKCVHPDGPILPATPEYFHRSKGSKDGLDYPCRQCASYARKTRIKSTPCPVCGGGVPSANGKYCSNKCQGIAFKGVERPVMKGHIPWSAGLTAEDDKRIADIARQKHKNVVDRDTLQKLYVEQGLSLKAIGKRYGVSKAPIKRLVKKYGLERPTLPRDSLTKDIVRELYEAGHNYVEIAKMYDCSQWIVNQLGLSAGVKGRFIHNKAGVDPNPGELYDRYWNEWLNYEQIAEHFSVDMTTIPYWLKKFNIPRRTPTETRRGPNWKPPDTQTVVHLYQAEMLSMKSIGEMVGEGRGLIKSILVNEGIEIRRSGYPNVSHYTSDDGHNVKSGLELQVDNWLCENEIPHIYEPQIADTLYKADFLVGDIFIEVWGLVGNKRYDKKRKKKLSAYEKHGLSLISVYPDDFPKLKVLEVLLV